MTYEEVAVRGGLSPDENMWVQRCRSDLHMTLTPKFRNLLHISSLLLEQTRKEVTNTIQL